jgi:hypothetical protein
MTAHESTGQESTGQGSTGEQRAQQTHHDASSPSSLFCTRRTAVTPNRSVGSSPSSSHALGDLCIATLLGIFELLFAVCRRPYRDAHQRPKRTRSSRSRTTCRYTMPFMSIVAIIARADGRAAAPAPAGTQQHPRHSHVTAAGAHDTSTEQRQRARKAPKPTRTSNCVASSGGAVRASPARAQTVSDDAPGSCRTQPRQRLV